MRQDRYIHSVQLNPMAESIHSLGPRGKELTIRLGWRNRIKLERRPPKNLEHFLGINDIRTAVLQTVEDLNLELDFFFASWELAQRGWTYSLIPDAVKMVSLEKKSTESGVNRSAFRRHADH